MNAFTPKLDRRQILLAAIGFPLACLAGLALLFWGSQPPPTDSPVSRPADPPAPPPLTFAPALPPTRSAESLQAELAALGAHRSKLLAERDALQDAIIRGDLGAIEAWIDDGRSLDFDFNEIYRGRTGESPLTLAVNRERREVVTRLLEAGVNVDRLDRHGHAAAHNARSMQMLRMLAAHAANLDLPDENGRSPLAVAATRGDLEKIDWLLALGARPYAQGQDDLLKVAYDFRHRELIAPLLSRGVKPRSPQLLFHAIEDGDLALARQLIEHGADVDAPHRKSSPLYAALYRQRWDIAGLLLDSGARVNLPDDGACAPDHPDCHSAALAKLASFHFPMLRRLVAAGLEIDGLDKDGHSALTALIVEEPMALALLTSYAPAPVVHLSPGADGVGSAAIMMGSASAAQRETIIAAPDNVARVAALLDAGADPNRKFLDQTPLMLAVSKLVQEGDPSSAEAEKMTALLISHGAGIEYQGTYRSRGADAFSNYSGRGVDDGMSVGPVTWTLQRRLPGIARRLVERDRRLDPADRDLIYFAAAYDTWDLLLAALPYAGSNVDANNRGGVTALMMAAQRGRVEEVKALLRAGADVNAKSHSSWPPLIGALVTGLPNNERYRPRLVGGYTALGAAVEAGQAEIATLLREAGARE
jgi:ankyrin repeat protein